MNKTKDLLLHVNHLLNDYPPKDGFYFVLNKGLTKNLQLDTHNFSTDKIRRLCDFYKKIKDEQ